MKPLSSRLLKNEDDGAKMKRLVFPLTSKEVLRSLTAGELVSLSGSLLAARDQTHRLLLEALEKGEELPVDLKGQCIYYVGPTPAPPGRPIGSAGPTTSYRMDRYTPRLLAEGLCATMGKGQRSPEVRRAMLEHEAVYFATFGGAGAYLSRRIKSSEVIAFPELGPEALLRLEVEDFPAVVINDLAGNDFYEETRRTWSRILQEVRR